MFLSRVGFVLALTLQIPGRGYASAKRDSGWRMNWTMRACRVCVEGFASDKEQRSGFDGRDSSDELCSAESSG